jgi:D-sedoheptulose 7-phosphate isomerase
VNDRIRAQIEESIATKQRLLAQCSADIEALCDLAIDVLAHGGTLFLCGNGGSSCDAAHAAGELVGWFEDKARGAIPAVALGHEVPTLTAVGNDAGYEHVFARPLQALGRPGDLLIGFSTSGGSKNVVRAMEVARERGLRRAALTGERGGPIADLADVAIRVPSTSTPRIQESHLVCVHALCDAVERAWPAIEERARAASRST